MRSPNKRTKIGILGLPFGGKDSVARALVDKVTDCIIYSVYPPDGNVNADFLVFVVDTASDKCFEHMKDALDATSVEYFLGRSCVLALKDDHKDHGKQVNAITSYVEGISDIPILSTDLKVDANTTIMYIRQLAYMCSSKFEHTFPTTLGSLKY
ncbi:hypothetical protein BC829DRAFT_396034 [Chytridium lagenaria]|nr:hypothetical protein BC829DRAFT_396034 [Chytridium lagenaria]